MLKTIKEEEEDEEVIFNNNIQLILNQTNYDKEMATLKLKEWDNNYMNVIREYLNPNFNEKKKETKKQSTNQRMMTEIRNLLNSIENNNISIYNNK
tara:strand:+ start:395 stop:682 length:288 start_codon:yes stop_codon:yes gene_type:complete